jgi:hypothetical protein
MAGMTDAVIRWSLWRTGRNIICTEQPAPGGLEVQVTYDNLPLAMQRCGRQEDAVRWAEALRRRWEATGWTPAEAPAESVRGLDLLTAQPR